MATVENVIETKVKAFAKDITKFLDGKRKAKEAKLKKEGEADPDKKLVKVTFAYSSGKGSISRSPEQQAESVSKGTSWTCAGAHMVDKARHVKMLYGAPGKKAKTSWDVAAAFGSKDEHFVTLSDLKTKWAALMKTHGLKNYKGKDGWGDGDAFHFELPDSKVPVSDKRVQACLAHYAKITRIDGKSTNSSFESSHWKKPLAPHLKKAEAEKKRLEEAERIAELKKMRFDGSSSGTVKLLNKANKTTSVSGAAFPDIDVPSPIDSGGSKAKSVQTGSALVWDSLARDIFEALGLAESSGFDVKVSCGVSYDLVTYDNLTQSFMRNLTPKCVLVYNTPVARAMKMTVTAKADVALTQSTMAPKGTLVFDVVLTSPLDTEKGTITVTIDGAKAKATAKLK